MVVRNAQNVSSQHMKILIVMQWSICLSSVKASSMHNCTWLFWKICLLMPSNAKYCIKQRCYIMHGIQLLYHYSLSPHSQVQAPQATTTINGCIRKATHTKQQQYDLWLVKTFNSQSKNRMQTSSHDQSSGNIKLN